MTSEAQHSRPVPDAEVLTFAGKSDTAAERLIDLLVGLDSPVGDECYAPTITPLAATIALMRQPQLLIDLAIEAGGLYEIDCGRVSAAISECTSPDPAPGSPERLVSRRGSLTSPTGSPIVVYEHLGRIAVPGTPERPMA